MRILIVEDEVKIREGMARLITAHTRHTVVGEAQNGEDGIKLALRFHPDLIITDIRMPVMDGLEMIEKLHGMQVRTHYVILSGYSEFDYARKALQFGADDYLLKPLAPEDVQKLLEDISARIATEERQKRGTPENALRELVFGGEEETPEHYEKFADLCGLRAGMRYLALRGYIGTAPLAYKEDFLHVLGELRAAFPHAFLCAVYHGSAQEMLCLCAAQELAPVQQAFVQRLLYPLRGQAKQPVFCAEELTTLHALKPAVERLRILLRQGIVLGGDELITAQIAQERPVENFVFPAEMNANIKKVICAGQREKLAQHADAFLDAVRHGCYAAQDVRQAFVRSYYTIVDTVQEIDTDAYTRLQNLGAIRRLNDAVTWEELKASYLDVIAVLASAGTQREDIRNYTIKRALHYIEEHAGEGITLEEVSAQLDITPEYLSTLFNREVGVNFSVFLRDFRLNQAKRLLKGTTLKVYEIAQKVGYSDAKYFTRVFKAEVGVSPGDYR